MWTQIGAAILMWALLLAPVRMQLLAPSPLLAKAVPSEAACNADYHFMCASGHCVPKSWRCDGSSDCRDDSDEVGCGCKAFHVACADGAGCVRSDDVCDGVRDCADGSDETALCARTCAEPDTALFRCASGDECVAARRRCDGSPHCGDGSDERGCGARDDAEGRCELRCDDGETCVPQEGLCNGVVDCRDGADEGAACGDPGTSLGPSGDHAVSRGRCGVADFACSSGECVPEIQRCDGEHHCRDASDESDCPPAMLTPVPKGCGHGERPCGGTGPACVSLASWCDGRTDCADASDEEECVDVWRTCRATEWLCENRKRCVPLSWRCDGEADCPDHSDERACDASVGLGPDWCRLSEFPCADGGCAAWASVCNGEDDCGDGSDEGERCGVAAEACGELRCSHRCHATPVGPVCVCPGGFKLGESGRSCVDRDECVDLAVPPCAQRCLNTEGNFSCACSDGYVLAPNGTCKATEPEAMLVYASLAVVTAVGLTTGDHVVLVGLAPSVVSLDFDRPSGRLYWYEWQGKRILWALVNGTENGTLYTGIAAEAIAVDWVARNIYWMDSESNCIMAAPLEAQTENEVAARVVIVGADVDDPQSLVLQATDGLMYWSEWGESPCISRAGMDGAGRKVLLADGLGWPNALALDLPSRRLYWIDAKLDSIECCNLDGSRRMVVATADVHNPFSLALFEDELYWSSLGAGKLEKANKLTGRGRATLFSHEHNIQALRVLHPLLQPEHPNPCASACCSHRCVLGAGGATAACACPPSTRLGSDGCTCEPTGALPFVLLVSPTAVTQVFVESREDRPHMQRLGMGHDLNRLTHVAYSHADRKLFYALEDAASPGRARVVPFDHSSGNDSTLQFLVMVQGVRDVAVDWSGENIYWLSADRPTVEATRLDALSARAVVVLSGSLQWPASLALDPSSGTMCLSDWGQAGAGGGGAWIECSRMDGTERRVLISFEGVARPDSLVMDANQSLLLWADEGLGMIQSIKLDGSDHKILHRGLPRIAGLAVVDGALFWVVNNNRSSELWREGGDRPWVQLRQRVMDVAASRTPHPADGLACRHIHCEHTCLVRRHGEVVCACPPALAVERTTSGSAACVPPSRCERPERRRCGDGGCVPALLWCDSVRDCDDGSDEEGCERDVNSPAEATTSQSRAFEAALESSNTSADAAGPTDLDDDKLPLTTTAKATPALSMEAPQPSTLVPSSSGKTTGVETPFVMPSCSDDYCSGRGSCEEEDDGLPTCTCRWGYRGPHCQFFVVQAIGVKAALGCATVIGVLVLAMVVVVVIRRRRRRRRLERHTPEQAEVTFTAEPKETSGQEMSLIGDGRSESLGDPSTNAQGQDSTEVV
ncbi:vitellogenin receptor Yl-like isoform X1 [Petromyzon marinus]|uniref:vitellogenin receptor Yl-like isoform X1 n=1 Tax=Petromyzon marinus TaxID=7757 RepID=UPI003F72F5FF